MEQENNNKYYTPDIEDLFIGYECERLVMEDQTPIVIENAQRLKEIIDKRLKGSKVWESYKIESPLYIVDLINSNLIRTKYLDKSDIEELGWTEVKERFKHPFLGLIEGYKIINETTGFNETSEYQLCKHPNSTIISIYRIYESSWGSQHEQIYSGNCPSINEGKKLMKMLNIL